LGVGRTLGFFAAVGAALAGGFLWGYAWGVEYALNNIANLRYFAECKGRWPSEWVFHPDSGEPNAGKPVAATQDARRYARPFARLSVLRRLEYDLAEKLPRIKPYTRRGEA
jgi:hypothetical protein